MASLPDSVRGDYELFAVRCSKCHSLARPLESGITDDTFWKEYVERMRRQPASGISPADEIPILRFLHFYSADKQHATRAPTTTPALEPPPAPAATPAPTSTEPAPTHAAPAPDRAEPVPDKEPPP